MEVKLSIIVPVYNVENYLGECLDSLVSQKCGEMEIICVNDGSTDGSVDILKKYNKRYPILKLVSKANGGLSSARNAGMEKAKGKYVVFVDSDDLWTDGDVASYIVNAMEKEKLDMLMFGIEAFYETKELEKRLGRSKDYYHYQKSYGLFKHGYEMLQALRQGHDYLSSACIKVIKREVLDKNNLKFYEGITHEDELFSFLLFMNVGLCRHVDKIFYLRRYRDGSIMTQKTSFKNLYGYFVAWRESLAWLRDNEIPNEAEGIAEEMLRLFEESPAYTYKKLDDDERKKIESCSMTDRYLLSKLLPNKPIATIDGNPFAFPYHLVPLNSRIIIYGAGDVGQNMWRQIQKEKMVIPVGMIDKNSAKINQPNVYSLKEMTSLMFDYIVIAIKDAGVAEVVKKNLEEMGIRDDTIKWDGGNYDVDKFHVNVLGKILSKEIVT